MKSKMRRIASPIFGAAFLFGIISADADVRADGLVFPPGQYQNLFTSTVITGSGADLTEDTLTTYTLPANSLKNVGDKLHIVAGGNFGATTDTKTARVRFGASLLSGTQANGTGQVSWAADIWVVVSAVNTFTTVAIGVVVNNTTGGTQSNTGNGIALTSAQTITVTGQNSTTATAGSIAANYLQVEVIKAP